MTGREPPRALAWERVVDELRRTLPTLHDDLLGALAFERDAEVRALVDASPEDILIAQGRARAAIIAYERAFTASERLTEAAARQSPRRMAP